MIAADSPILSWFFQFGSLASFPMICTLCLGHFTDHDFGLLPLLDYTELSSGRRIIHSFCKINNFQLKCSIIAHSFQFFEHDCLWKSLSQQLRHNVHVPLKHPWFQIVYFTAQWTQYGVRMGCSDWPIGLFSCTSALHMFCRKFFF